jgi:hypothetical protein
MPDARNFSDPWPQCQQIFLAQLNLRYVLSLPSVVLLTITERHVKNTFNQVVSLGFL